jgi:very-short-patch-repair endonuclease
VINPWDEKNLIGQKNNSENKNAFGIIDTMNDTAKELNKKECLNIGKQWKKNCSNCNKIQIYKSRRSHWNAKKKNSVCLSCKNSGTNNPFYGKSHSNEYKNKLSSIQKRKGSYRYKNTGGNPPKIEKWCIVCNKQYFVVACQEKSKYCTYKCATVDNFGLGNGRMTSPEIEIEQYLKNNNIQYKYGYVLCGKIYDFYLVKTNILIEVDGIYWHGKNKSDNELNEIQLKNKKNDALKNKIAVDNGYKLVRIWEDEVKNVSKYLYK